MLKTVQITETEKELLIGWYQGGNNALIRNRAHTVLLNNQGLNALRISKILFRDYKTVRRWLSTFKRERLSSLFPKYKGNNSAGKLTPAQKKRVKEVLSQPPSDYGIPKEFWEVRDLKKWIKVEFGVVYESKRSYHFLFKLGRFSWKLPDKFDIQRDDEFVAKRIKEIREEIKPYLKSPDWVVLTSNETRLVWENESRRAWLRTNQKTIIRVHRSRDYQSFLGSLNLKTKKCHLHSLAWQNQEETINALRKIRKYYPGKKICLIWDNAPWHKGREIRQELSRGGNLDNFHLINLPPYAPDTNPQEKVWKYVKDKIAHKFTTSFKQRINDFKLAVIHRKFNYRI